MKLESASSFYQNLSLNRDNIRLIGISGASKDELASLADFFLGFHVKKWQMPDDLAEFQQLSLIPVLLPEVFLGLDKIKKHDIALVLDYVKQSQNLCCLLATSSSTLQMMYSELKNEVLWLDLSLEKPWQKKERYSFLLQAKAKQDGYQLDKQAAVYLVENTQEDFDQAASRLKSCVIYASNDKKITLDTVKLLLPETACELSFQWIDQLLYKKEPLDLPDIHDASDLLLCFGQIRYSLTTGLKLKSLLQQHVGIADMKSYFPKLSQQALSMQLKKVEDVSTSYLESLMLLVHEKELELKQDFQQPKAVFIDLVSQITKQKLCLKPVS